MNYLDTWSENINVYAKFEFPCSKTIAYNLEHTPTLTFVAKNNYKKLIFLWIKDNRFLILMLYNKTETLWYYSSSIIWDWKSVSKNKIAGIYI